MVGVHPLGNLRQIWIANNLFDHFYVLGWQYTETTEVGDKNDFNKSGINVLTVPN